MPGTVLGSLTELQNRLSEGTYLKHRLPGPCADVLSPNCTVGVIPFTYAEACCNRQVYTTWGIHAEQIVHVFLCIFSDFPPRIPEEVSSLTLIIITIGNIYGTVTVFHKYALPHLILNNPMRLVLLLRLIQFTDEGAEAQKS